MKCDKCGHLLENHHKDSALSYGFCWHCECQGGRDVFPALKSVTTVAGGDCAVDAMRKALDRASEEGDERIAQMCERWLATYAIPESDLNN
jgi:hypothetical protein